MEKKRRKPEKRAKGESVIGWIGEWVGFIIFDLLLFGLFD